MSEIHGWILQDGGNESFVTDTGDSSNCIKRSKVYSTRREARESAIKIDGDGVRKVRITSQGRAVKIIPGR